jgi:hypothetical protein
MTIPLVRKVLPAGDWYWPAWKATSTPSARTISGQIFVFLAVDIRGRALTRYGFYIETIN